MKANEIQNSVDLELFIDMELPKVLEEASIATGIKQVHLLKYATQLAEIKSTLGGSELDGYAFEKRMEWEEADDSETNQQAYAFLCIVDQIAENEF